MSSWTVDREIAPWVRMHRNNMLTAYCMPYPKKIVEENTAQIWAIRRNCLLWRFSLCSTCYFTCHTPNKLRRKLLYKSTTFEKVFSLESFTLRYMMSLFGFPICTCRLPFSIHFKHSKIHMHVTNCLSKCWIPQHYTISRKHIFSSLRATQANLGLGTAVHT